MRRAGAQRAADHGAHQLVGVQAALHQRARPRPAARARRRARRPRRCAARPRSPAVERRGRHVRATASRRARGPISTGSMSPAARASSAADRLTASQGWTTAILIAPERPHELQQAHELVALRERDAHLRQRAARALDALGRRGHGRLAGDHGLRRPGSCTCSRATRRPFPSSREVTFTAIVSVSPTRIGARNFSVWPVVDRAGPGSRVPSTAEMSAAPHMPCAITPWSPVDAANSASRWRGLTSPDIAANSWMSAAVSVRSMLARSPTAISSKVRLRGSRGLGGRCCS